MVISVLIWVTSCQSPIGPISICGGAVKLSCTNAVTSDVQPDRRPEPAPSTVSVPLQRRFCAPGAPISTIRFGAPASRQPSGIPPQAQPIALAEAYSPGVILVAAPPLTATV